MSEQKLSLHQGQPVLRAGAPLAEARSAVVMIHGRGATAGDILGLSAELDAPNIAFLAPQAAGFAWYPLQFMAPIESNEPYLSSALAAVEDLVGHVERAGLGRERIALLGFSQGACLALEFAVRHPARYGGVVGLSGGLIGPEGTVWATSGSLNGVPVFLGCSDVDPHIPQVRVDETADVFRRCGALVTERIYPGLPHTVNEDEIEFVRQLLATIG